MTERRGLLSARFTGTRGQVETLDDPKLFSRRYIDNRKALVESLEDRGASQATIDDVRGDLAVAEALSPGEWAEFIDYYRGLPVMAFEQQCVSAWMAGTSREPCQSAKSIPRKRKARSKKTPKSSIKGIRR